MKFSVLLPTRNRLELLQMAVETVRRQDYNDWEIVISDNCSDAPISPWIYGLGDTRIRYYRTEGFLPVTDNWNNALQYATGDYVVMLGDDDALLPGYFSRMKKLIETFGEPEMVYCGAVHFCYPDVQPEHPDGYTTPHIYLKRKNEGPYLLPHGAAASIAHSLAKFRMPIGLNMQYSLLSAGFIRRMSRDGKFYHSPYPDYYATTVCFSQADRLLVVPEPLVAIGIGKQSFGFYLSNDLVGEGAKFLNNFTLEGVAAKAREQVLPGGYHNSCWLLAMIAASALFPDDAGLKPRYRRYRRYQIANIYKRYILDHAVPKSLKADLGAQMTPWERLTLGLPLTVLFHLLKVLPRRQMRSAVDRIRGLAGQYPHYQFDYKPLGSARNILDYFEHLRSSER